MTGTETACPIDDALISVWRQVLVELKKTITVGNSSFSVRRTAKHHLAQFDFEVEGVEFRGLEQNPQTKSRWAKMAREGAKVMQFLRAGRYVAVVADGVLKHYSSTEKV
jgi:porphobilinogen deaminase